MRQYLYFCTSKASNLRTRLAAEAGIRQRALRAEKSEDGICEFTCFTGTTVQILVRCLLALLVSERAFCAEKREEGICEHNVLRQYLYICTSKSSILRTKRALRAEKGKDTICEDNVLTLLLRQYLYCCTSKEIKMKRTCEHNVLTAARARSSTRDASLFVLLHQYSK
jgi:hypothetical protein